MLNPTRTELWRCTNRSPDRPTRSPIHSLDIFDGRNFIAHAMRLVPIAKLYRVPRCASFALQVSLVRLPRFDNRNALHVLHRRAKRSKAGAPSEGEYLERLPVVWYVAEEALPGREIRGCDLPLARAIACGLSTSGNKVS